MSFWGKVGGWLWGIDVDAEKKRAEELDRRIAEQNARARATGKWSEEEYQAAETRREAAKAWVEDTNLWRDFGEGAVEGAKSVASTGAKAVRGALDTVGQFTLRAIPWWVWLLGLGFVAFQLGWWKLLKR